MAKKKKKPELKMGHNGHPKSNPVEVDLGLDLEDLKGFRASQETRIKERPKLTKKERRKNIDRGVAAKMKEKGKGKWIELDPKNEVDSPAKTLALTKRSAKGTLRHGNPGNVGNRGSMGAPASAVRARLRGSYENRLNILEDIVDGTAIEKTTVKLSDVLKYAYCPKCQLKLDPKLEKDKTEYITIEAYRSAKVQERLAGLDQMAKYGLGTTREISVEEVKHRLVLTIEIIQNQLNPQDAHRVIKALKPIWSSS